jgi:2-polyprenyl-3-methyl-5-hydroxy-6-metoxy-1,4-benzoquinol methylase
MPLDAFRQTNQVNWNERTHIHAASRSYHIASYITDPHKISDVVRFDVADLGNVRGHTLLHLQCHIGTDTLSLARLGAIVTGIDFSPDAIETARQLSADCGTPARFEVAELYDTPKVIHEKFDIVYTGVGALTWLPDIGGWGRVVAAMLKPGGRLLVRDFHPMLWTIDDEQDEKALVVQYPYFETPLTRFEHAYTYSDGDRLTNTVTYEWNHGLGEIVMSLIDNGLQLTLLKEHKIAESRYLPCMVRDADGRWRLPHGEDRLPLMYTIRAVQRG